jgi:hypothetical protein
MLSLYANIATTLGLLVFPEKKHEKGFLGVDNTLAKFLVASYGLEEQSLVLSSGLIR